MRRGLFYAVLAVLFVVWLVHGITHQEPELNCGPTAHRADVATVDGWEPSCELNEPK